MFLSVTAILLLMLSPRVSAANGLRPHAGGSLGLMELLGAEPSVAPPRLRRSVFLHPGVKICPHETVSQVLASHQRYYQLRVCQEAVWEAFRIFLDRVPGTSEYERWVQTCQQEAACISELGLNFGRSEEHHSLIRRRLNGQKNRRTPPEPSPRPELAPGLESEHGPETGPALELAPGPESGPESEPGPNTEPEPSPQPEPSLGPELEPSPGPEPDPEPSLGPELGPSPGPEPEPSLGPELEPSPGPEPDPEPSLGPELGPSPGPEPEPSLGPELEPSPGPEPDPEPSLGPELGPSPGQGPDQEPSLGPELGPSPEQVPDQEPSLGPEPEPSLGPELEPSPGPEPDPEPSLGPEPEPSPGPEPSLGPEPGQQPGADLLPTVFIGSSTGPAPFQTPDPQEVQGAELQNLVPESPLEQVLDVSSRKLEQPDSRQNVDWTQEIQNQSRQPNSPNQLVPEVKNPPLPEVPLEKENSILTLVDPSAVPDLVVHTNTPPVWKGTREGSQSGPPEGLVIKHEVKTIGHEETGELVREEVPEGPASGPSPTFIPEEDLNPHRLSLELHYTATSAGGRPSEPQVTTLSAITGQPPTETTSHLHKDRYPVPELLELEKELEFNPNEESREVQEPNLQWFEGLEEPGTTEVPDLEEEPEEVKTESFLDLEMQPKGLGESSSDTSEDVGSEVPTEPEPEVPEEIEPDVPGETEPEVPEEPELDVPEEPKPEVPQESEPDIPEETEPEDPEDPELEVPQEAEPEIPEETEPVVPEEPELEVPEDPESEVLKETEPDVPEELEVPQEIGPDVPEETVKGVSEVKAAGQGVVDLMEPEPVPLAKKEDELIAIKEPEEHQGGLSEPGEKAEDLDPGHSGEPDLLQPEEPAEEPEYTSESGVSEEGNPKPPAEPAPNPEEVMVEVLEPPAQPVQNMNGLGDLHFEEDTLQPLEGVLDPGGKEAVVHLSVGEPEREHLLLEGKGGPTWTTEVPDNHLELQTLSVEADLFHTPPPASIQVFEVTPDSGLFQVSEWNPNWSTVMVLAEDLEEVPQRGSDGLGPPPPPADMVDQAVKDLAVELEQPAALDQGSGFAPEEGDVALPTMRYPTPPPSELVVFFSLRVTNMNFTDDLFNKTSPEYQSLETTFMHLLLPPLRSSLRGFRQLEVLSFRRGSVVVNSRLRVRGWSPSALTRAVQGVLERFCFSGATNRLILVDRRSLDVEAADRADPCKFLSCEPFSRCQVNARTKEGQCVCDPGSMALDGLLPDPRL